MTIKLATYEDLDKVVDIVKQYRDFYQVASQDVTEIKQFINARLSNQDSKIFIAVNDEKIVGFIQLYPSFSTVSLKPQWILNDFYVTPNERLKGYGTALMTAVIDYFKSTAKGFILVTEKTNHTAKRFYQKCGLQTNQYDFYTYYY